MLDANVLFITFEYLTPNSTQASTLLSRTKSHTMFVGLSSSCTLRFWLESYTLVISTSVIPGTILRSFSSRIHKFCGKMTNRVTAHKVERSRES